MAIAEWVYASQRRTLVGLEAALLSRLRGEFYEIRVVDCRNRVVWSSGRQELDTLARPFDRTFSTSCGHRRFSLRLLYWYVNPGQFPASITLRLSLPSRPQNGQQRFVWPLSNYSVPDLVDRLRRVARSRKMRLRTGPYASRSSLRPSPESLNDSYLEGSVNWLTGTQSIAPTNYVRYLRTWTGVRTPNFGRKKGKGKLPVNNHSVSLMRLQNFGEERRKQGFFQNNGALASDTSLFQKYWSQGFNPPNPSHAANSYNVALKRLIDKSGGLSANLAQDIAQISQTLGVITDAASRIARSLTAIRQRNLAGAANALWQGQNPRFRRGRQPSNNKSLADNWLSFQYGWKPLLSDIRGSMEALARYNFASTSVNVVASSATTKTESLLVHQTNDLNPTRIGDTRIVSTTRTRIGIRYTIPSPLIAFLAQTGFTNPVNLAWELLPFSFVVDWFLPIGPYLETLSAWDGLSFMDGFRIDFTRQEIRGKLMFNGKYNADPQVYPDQYSWRGAYIRDWILFDRTKLTSFPSARRPELRNGISTERAANAYALMVQVFKR